MAVQPVLRAALRVASYGPVPMPDRRTPFTLTGEKETLLEFLDYLRESLILKIEDLDEESARKSTVPTGTSLIGLVKHLTGVEVAWFQFAFAGFDPVIPAEAIEPTDTVASVVDYLPYRCRHQQRDRERLH